MYIIALGSSLNTITFYFLYVFYCTLYLIIAILNLILNVVVVDVNVFSALIVALTYYKLDRGLVITVELYRINISTVVANLL
jgi:hypothetical protein